MVQTIRQTMEIFVMHITITVPIKYLFYSTFSRWLPFRRRQRFTRFITPSMARAHVSAVTERTARLIAVLSSGRLLGSPLYTIDFRKPTSRSPEVSGQGSALQPYREGHPLTFFIIGPHRTAGGAQRVCMRTTYGLFSESCALIEMHIVHSAPVHCVEMLVPTC